MIRNILVLTPVNETHKKLLEAAAPEAHFTFTSMEAAKLEQVEDAYIILGNPTAEMLAHSNKLQWLQVHSAGVGEYTRAGVLPEGVVLTNASGAYGLAISESMLGVLLELFKKLHLYRDRQAEASWSWQGAVRAVFGSTALIIGAGDIGGEFAIRLKALGAYTIGIRRSGSDKPDYLDELYNMDSLEALLPRADIVSLSLPATSLTEKVINRKTLALMKPDAVLINVGRGSAIDTEALCDALESGHLSGAALDVTDPEPLPENHRLWRIKNAIITPHVFGGFNMKETHDRIIGIFAENLRAFSEGRELTNIVDRSEGY